MLNNDVHGEAWWPVKGAGAMYQFHIGTKESIDTTTGQCIEIIGRMILFVFWPVEVHVTKHNIRTFNRVVQPCYSKSVTVRFLGCTLFVIVHAETPSSNAFLLWRPSGVPP